MAGRLKIAALAGAAVGVGLSGAALASGVSGSLPWYIDQYGGGLADRQARYDGRLGVVMTRAPDPQLFVVWRLLHGRSVGRPAGAALEVPCCSAPDSYNYDEPNGPYGWLRVRKALMADAPPIESISTSRDGPNYTTIENCYPDAFDAAAQTLKSRAEQYGAASPAVKAWLATQDAVFDLCANPEAKLPPPMAGAPAWLDADRAYQEAAFALYSGRHAESADRFAAIGRDRASPWRDKAPYLIARARVRAVLASKGEADDAAARAALTALASAPAGTYGREAAAGWMDVIDYRMRPTQMLSSLEAKLNGKDIGADAAVAFRDFNNLGRTAPKPPETVDWLITLKAKPAEPVDGSGGSTDVSDQARIDAADAAALGHARARWSAGHDVAWLVAALSLANPTSPDAKALIADAEQVAPASPAWLTAQYHAIRLSLPTGDPEALRLRLDGLLARADLSVSDRNLFAAQRSQVAADLADFVRHALRESLCEGVEDDRETDCVRDKWFESAGPWGVLDQTATKGGRGFGEDARATIDRMPMAPRLALAAQPQLPAKLRLDVAMTNFGRAVQLQDNAAIDSSARLLATLLPQAAAEWRAVIAAAPGPDKRFAEFLVLAKIPGLNVDLIRYSRPDGATLAAFPGTWVDWVIPGPGKPPGAKPPALALYQQAGVGVSYDDPDALTDLTCLGVCGRGVAPLRLPAFVAVGQAQAAKERAYLYSPAHDYDAPPPAIPAGAVAAWDEMLGYAAAHPKDPRVPEALYWLVRVGRWGGTHNHSGQRAFKLLHARYGASNWAKRSPYYYD